MPSSDPEEDTMPLPEATLEQWRREREEHVAKARAIHERAANDNGRALTEAESTEYKGHVAETRRLKDTIEREEEIARQEREIEEATGSQGRQAPATDPSEETSETGERGAGDLPRSPANDNRSYLDPEVWPTRYRGERVPEASRAEVELFRSRLRTSPSIVAQMGEEEREQAFAAARRAQAAVRSQRGQTRGQEMGQDALGGYITVPPQLLAGILQGADERTFMRQLGTVWPSGAEGLGVVALASDVDDADWTTELTTGDETEVQFEGRELKPGYLSKKTKISMFLIRNQRIPIEAFIRARLGYKFGVTFEKAAMTGPGARKPLGIFTASDHGVSTARDISTANTATGWQPENWIRAKRMLHSNYRINASLVAHPDVITLALLWKDGEGRYLFTAARGRGNVDELDGVPVRESAYAPSTLTTGQYIAVLGDLSYYWWADAMQFTVQVLNELYAETNQIGLIGRAMVDGMPVLEEAFVRLKLG